MTFRGVLLLFAVALLAGCGQGEVVIATPREPGADAVGYYCRMTLAEHKGPKGQILLKGWAEPLWFSSVRDALTYVEADLVSEREMSGFWVNDMSKGSWTQGSWDHPAPGSWIDARSAWFVVGSQLTSSMGGGEAVPFKDRTAAETFVSLHGGRVADYRGALSETAEAPMAGPRTGGGT
jgi:copper chaperone NosL